MKSLYAKDRAAWQGWLKKHHKTAKEIWLIHYRNATGQPSIPYDDAVEEALCFGWIDGKIRKLDAERYARLFTPRRPGSRWAPSNIARVKNLVAQGKMTEAGFKAFESHEEKRTPTMPAELPPILEERFRLHASAWENFSRFPPYYRRMTSGWVAGAKKEETQLKRLEKLIEFSARNERIKFM